MALSRFTQRLEYFVSSPDTKGSGANLFARCLRRGPMSADQVGVFEVDDDVLEVMGTQPQSSASAARVRPGEAPHRLCKEAHSPGDSACAANCAVIVSTNRRSGQGRDRIAIGRFSARNHKIRRDSRGADRALVGLTNRRLQPLGHLTADAKYT